MLSRSPRTSIPCPGDSAFLFCHAIQEIDDNMTDPKQLDVAISTLRAEIQALDRGDDKARQRLEELIRDIETSRASSPGSESGESVGKRLQASILHFEASHPRLAGVMTELVETLSNMGI
jgi:Domain of unknown function (DUF4404)